MENTKNEIKYKEWLDTGLVREQDYKIFSQIMDEYHPQNRQQIRLAYLKFIYTIGEITKEEYDQSLAQ